MRKKQWFIVVRFILVFFLLYCSQTSFRSFHWNVSMRTKKMGHFMAHWSIAALKFFKGNLSWNFGLIAVFVKVALKIIQKELSIASYPDSHDFVLFEIAQVYLRLADCRVYKGHLQNEWAIKPFRKHPKSSKFVCVKSSLQFMHNLYPISINSSYRFLWNVA